jgi:hypothetical protein
MSASAADRVFQAAMALAPLSAGACRTGFVILTAKPIAGHAQRASGGNSGQDDPAAAGALDVDPGRRQAPAPHPGRRPCRRTPRQSRHRPPLRSSKRLPGTSVSLPGITLSDKGGQGERADPPIWRQVQVSRHIVRAAPERPFCVAGVCRYSPSDQTCSHGSGVHTVASDESHERRWPE